MCRVGAPLQCCDFLALSSCYNIDSNMCVSVFPRYVPMDGLWNWLSISTINAAEKRLLSRIYNNIMVRLVRSPWPWDEIRFTTHAGAAQYSTHFTAFAVSPLAFYQITLGAAAISRIYYLRTLKYACITKRT